MESLGSPAPELGGFSSPALHPSPKDTQDWDPQRGIQEEVNTQEGHRGAERTAHAVAP